MTGIGIYIANTEDKLVTPGKYFSADEYWALVLKNVSIAYNFCYQSLLFNVIFIKKFLHIYMGFGDTLIYIGYITIFR